MWQRLKNIDWHLHHEFPLLLLLLLITILRIPNFFEPYWYGDEGIYLTIGTALKQGALLYKDIVDHKTPIIYYLAMVPNQVYFRLLLTGWMFVTTAAFYHLSLRLLKSLKLTILTTLQFIVLTTMPWFEGHIPNGELFVMGFVMVGAVLLLHTQLYQRFFEHPDQLVKANRYHHPIQQMISQVLHRSQDVGLLLAAGFFLGLAILTKVPALFDAVALMSVAWFSVTRTFSVRSWRAWRLRLTQVITQSSLVAIGLVIPILLSILYYALRGSLPEYLEFGLLYNFRYIQSWGLPFDNPTLVFLFSLPGKALVLTGTLLLFTLLKKWLSPIWQFVLAWFAISLFATLLSNRPYPHYFLQVMPALSLLIGLMIQKTYQWLQTVPARRLSLLQYLVPSVLGLLCVAFFIRILVLLDVGLYPTLKYYRTSWSYLTGSISRDEYYQSFNHLMHENYLAAEVIAPSEGDTMLIWGTNPMLYALSQKSPTGRFTVLFHIKDFQAEAETVADLKAAAPTYVVVMHNEDELPADFTEYLFANYMINNNFTNFSVWKRLPS